MTPPSKSVRGLTYLRDGHRCLACGSRDALTWQHRAASGMGGRGVKAPALTPADGCTLCVLCNASCEAEGQTLALSMGWKIRRNRGAMPASAIPVFDVNERRWFTIDVEGGREICNAITALELLDLAGSLTVDRCPDCGLRLPCACTVWAPVTVPGSSESVSKRDRLGVANSDASEVWNSEASATPATVESLWSDSMTLSDFPGRPHLGGAE